MSYLQRNLKYNTIVKTSYRNQNDIIDCFREIIGKNDELIIQDKINIGIIGPNFHHCQEIAHQILSDFDYLQRDLKNGIGSFYIDSVNIEIFEPSVIRNSMINFNYVIILNADYINIDLLHKYLNTSASVLMTVDSKKFTVPGRIVNHIEPGKSFFTSVKEMFRCCNELE